jgi:hypothetical protein
MIRIGSALLFLSAILVLSASAFAKDLMVANFERGDISDLGTMIGTWTSNTLDYSQGTTIEIIQVYGVMGKTGSNSHVAKVTYDVAANGPALNGIYIKLNNLDLRPYKNLSMLIKGDAAKGFTTKFSIQLKNARGQRSSCVLSGVTDDWQRLSIPLEQFKATRTMWDLSNMMELDIAFDDMTVDDKNGVLYIDEIRFTTD